jgi:UDP-galactose transporter B1
MMGSLLLGGAKYSPREYLSVGAIIAGTCIVSMGKKSKGGESSMIGLLFVILSLACDGINGGVQKRLKAKAKEINGREPTASDFMLWTNLFMCITAVLLAVTLNDLFPGIQFCVENPVILTKIVNFSICSAVGQTFIFYSLANFDPLVVATVTTTRKVFTVLISIFLNGHALSTQGWVGISLACTGIFSELVNDKKAHSPGSEKKGSEHPKNK